MPDQSWVPSLYLHSYPCQPSTRSSPAPLRHRSMKQSKLFQSQQRSNPLGWLKMRKFRLSSCPFFPKSHSRLSSLSCNASSPNPPCVFPARNALVHCLGIWPPPSTPMAPSTVIYRANRELDKTQQPHTCPSWICQTLPVKGKVGSVIPAVKPSTFPNLHGQLACLSKSNTGYRLVC